MICQICKNEFYIQKTFLTLFQTKKYWLCDACKKQYPFSYHTQTIPLDRYELRILSLFNKNYKIDLNAWTEELSFIFQFVWLKYPPFFVIFLEEFILSDDMIEFLDWLSKEEKKSIFILCFFLRN